MQPSNSSAPPQTEKSMQKLHLTVQERARNFRFLFAKLDAHFTSICSTRISRPVLRRCVSRAERAIRQSATSRQEYSLKVAEWLFNVEKYSSAHECRGPEWKLRLTISKRRRVYEHILRLLKNLSMTAPAHDHLRRAASMYELFAFSTATSGPQYLSLVANGLASLENGGTCFSTSWQNDIPWETRSKVRTHIFSKLGPKLHPACLTFNHLYQTHPDIPPSFEATDEAIQKPCAVLIESYAFVTATSHLKYLDRVADGICNVQNGRPWNDPNVGRQITSDEREKVREHILNKLTERNASEALPQELKQRIDSFESYAFRKAISRQQYFERIADGLTKHENCTINQTQHSPEPQEYMGSSARAQCRDFVEANLKAETLSPLYPEQEELKTLATSLEEEVFKCATTVYEYVDMLVNQVRLMNDFSASIEHHRPVAICGNCIRHRNK